MFASVGPVAIVVGATSGHMSMVGPGGEPGLTDCWPQPSWGPLGVKKLSSSPPGEPVTALG
jgi:hypothetical protein